MTALHYATFNNRLAVVKVLLKHGADRTLKNKNGNTAASIAASRKLQDISDLLTPKQPSTTIETPSNEVLHLRSNAVAQQARIERLEQRVDHLQVQLMTLSEALDQLRATTLKPREEL
eukprot:m.159209 g.159209  ORF g.159209 m.159209 type:complete len:118 (-) comp53008_c0_seq1:800-1153(-)